MLSSTRQAHGQRIMWLDVVWRHTCTFSEGQKLELVNLNELLTHKLFMMNWTNKVNVSILCNKKLLKTECLSINLTRTLPESRQWNNIGPYLTVTKSCTYCGARDTLPLLVTTVDLAWPAGGTWLGETVIGSVCLGWAAKLCWAGWWRLIIQLWQAMC